MQTKSITLLFLCCTLASPFAGSPCFGAEEESKQVFDSLFAAKIKAVSATSSRADDVALAGELLAVAKASTEQTGLLALICDAAYDLGFRTAEGYQAAIEAQQLLAEYGKDKREGAQEKLITLLTRQSTTGKADEREAAGESLIALLLSMGDEKFEKKQYAEAAGDYRRAVSVATQRKSASLEEAKAKLEFAAGRDRAVKNLARLQEKLLKDANDFATAEEIVKIYVIEFDDPAGAVPYLNRVKDEQLKEVVPLAIKVISNLNDEEALALVEWYGSITRTAPKANVAAMAQRTIGYGTRFLEVNQSPGVGRVKVELILAEAKKHVPAGEKLSSHSEALILHSAVQLKLAGSGFTIAKLQDGAAIFSNRDYVLKKIPKELDGWSFARFAMEGKRSIQVAPITSGMLYVATSDNQILKKEHWKVVPTLSFAYNTDRDDVHPKIYSRAVSQGEVVDVSGMGIILIPPAKK